MHTKNINLELPYYLKLSLKMVLSTSLKTNISSKLHDSSSYTPTLQNLSGGIKALIYPCFSHIMENMGHHNRYKPLV